MAGRGGGPRSLARLASTRARAPPLTRALLPSYHQIVKLKAFEKFETTTDALAAATALVDSKLSKCEWSAAACKLAAGGGPSAACKSRTQHPRHGGRLRPPDAWA